MGNKSKWPYGTAWGMRAADALVLLILIEEGILVGKHIGTGIAIDLVLKTDEAEIGK